MECTELFLALLFDDDEEISNISDFGLSAIKLIPLLDIVILLLLLFSF